MRTTYASLFLSTFFQIKYLALQFAIQEWLGLISCLSRQQDIRCTGVPSGV